MSNLDIFAAELDYRRDQIRRDYIRSRRSRTRLPFARRAAQPTRTR